MANLNDEILKSVRVSREESKRMKTKLLTRRVENRRTEAPSTPDIRTFQWHSDNIERILAQNADENMMEAEQNRQNRETESLNEILDISLATDMHESLRSTNINAPRGSPIIPLRGARTRRLNYSRSSQHNRYVTFIRRIIRFLCRSNRQPDSSLRRLIGLFLQYDEASLYLYRNRNYALVSHIYLLEPINQLFYALAFMMALFTAVYLPFNLAHNHFDIKGNVIKDYVPSVYTKWVKYNICCIPLVFVLIPVVLSGIKLRLHFPELKRQYMMLFMIGLKIMLVIVQIIVLEVVDYFCETKISLINGCPMYILAVVVFAEKLYETVFSLKKMGWKRFFHVLIGPMMILLGVYVVYYDMKNTGHLITTNCIILPFTMLYFRDMHIYDSMTVGITVTSYFVGYYMVDHIVPTMVFKFFVIFPALCGIACGYYAVKYFHYFPKYSKYFGFLDIDYLKTGLWDR
ncbi:hypothetical protein EDEG_03951 [Edhazardia aedis USNM 41457]|uniref:Uncharacterized protein n=1 Tax=Edhazardia aedis (strain USNM 41457) TaxID=1003232 RepID=J8ZP32_EDHAE|nr:hypothetical protein EDEG_03951 [Edhazardia aedis USNM 41457]|eukprot:EJW01463.1 hypothetical protein EDEG_03951 [Edhazardia aedis USNM 41457]